jgi:hypothetical protein
MPPLYFPNMPSFFAPLTSGKFFCTNIRMLQLTVLVFQEYGVWVAQCLEHDIAAQAEKAPMEAVGNLERQLLGHLTLCRPLPTPAPPKYWHLLGEPYTSADVVRLHTKWEVPNIELQLTLHSTLSPFSWAREGNY